MTPKQLKRAAMTFLASLQPSALAIDAAAGGHCRADAAAFWMEKGRITRTAISPRLATRTVSNMFTS